MGILIFKLRNVPDDEAEEVRALLTQHGIDFYETHAGTWGIGVAGIWLHNHAKQDKAKALLEDYQQERTQRMRQAYTELCAKGEQRRFMDLVKESPVKIAAYLIAIGFLFYVTAIAFVSIFSNH